MHRMKVDNLQLHFPSIHDIDMTQRIEAVFTKLPAYQDGIK